MNGRIGEKDEYSHFDTHNIFAYFESIPTFKAAKLIDNSRGFVITRSTFLGSGKYGGHWTGVCYCDKFWLLFHNKHNYLFEFKKG